MPEGIEQLPMWIAAPAALVLLVVYRRQIIRDRRALRELNK